MRPVVITAGAGAVTTAPVPLDRYLTPFQVTVACVVTGVVAYKLQYSYDDMFDTTITPTWWDDSDIPAGTAASAESAFDNPISGLRIVKASGSGSVTATINQAGAR